MVILDRALCLPVPDIQSLCKGQTIAAISRVFLDKGSTFALYPAEDCSTAQIQSRYHPFVVNSFLPSPSSDPERVCIIGWARCDSCEIIGSPEDCDRISRLTIWKQDYLVDFLEQNQRFFLAILQIHSFPEPIWVAKKDTEAVKLGKFVALADMPSGTSYEMVLEEKAFIEYKRRFEQEEQILFPGLEELLAMTSSCQEAFEESHCLQRKIHQFLGRRTSKEKNFKSDHSWVLTIAQVGNSSDGHTFEKLVRKSFLALGFRNSQTDLRISLDPDATGGAGGIDFYCDYPYEVIGECKASKTEKVPDGTAAQLIKLGHKFFADKFDQQIKMIIAAGSLTKAAEMTAQGNKMNVIRPETLQALVELQIVCPGSVNLRELESCLQAGPFGEMADQKVKEYIATVWRSLKVRADIIQAVKQLDMLESHQPIAVQVQYNALFVANSANKLSLSEVSELLIELSSPLAGYVGREGDRFYFLRDLVIEPLEKAPLER